MQLLRTRSCRRGSGAIILTCMDPLWTQHPRMLCGNMWCMPKAPRAGTELGATVEIVSHNRRLICTSRWHSDKVDACEQDKVPTAAVLRLGASQRRGRRTATATIASMRIVRFPKSVVSARETHCKQTHLLSYPHQCKQHALPLHFSALHCIASKRSPASQKGETQRPGHPQRYLPMKTAAHLNR